MMSSGKKTKSKTILGLKETQSSLEQLHQGLDPIEATSATFEDAKDALEILIAQCGSPNVRKAHRGRIMGYLILQERRLRTLERRAKTWGYDDETEHCLALAKMWDKVDE